MVFYRHKGRYQKVFNPKARGGSPGGQFFIQDVKDGRKKSKIKKFFSENPSGRARKKLKKRFKKRSPPKNRKCPQATPSPTENTAEGNLT